MDKGYNGSLTREKFLFYEIRIVAKLVFEGLSNDDIITRIHAENLFQFPTEKLIDNIANVCLKRVEALKSKEYIDILANGSVETAKQVNLLAMMKYNRLVWDFMTIVIGEKYRTQDLYLTQRDLNVFMTGLKEQSDVVATWSDSTVAKIKQVLKRSIMECGYLDSIKEERLNPVTISFELEELMKQNGDYAALPAFNCFD